jgi:hypothetical protein
MKFIWIGFVTAIGAVHGSSLGENIRPRKFVVHHLHQGVDSFDASSTRGDHHTAAVLGDRRQSIVQKDVRKHASAHELDQRAKQSPTTTEDNSTVSTVNSGTNTTTASAASEGTANTAAITTGEPAPAPAPQTTSTATTTHQGAETQWDKSRSDNLDSTVLIALLFAVVLLILGISLYCLFWRWQLFQFLWFVEPHRQCLIGKTEPRTRLSWIYDTYNATDQEILQHSGMDTLIFMHMLKQAIIFLLVAAALVLTVLVPVYFPIEAIWVDGPSNSTNSTTRLESDSGGGAAAAGGTVSLLMQFTGYMNDWRASYVDVDVVREPWGWHAGRDVSLSHYNRLGDGLGSYNRIGLESGLQKVVFTEDNASIQSSNSTLGRLSLTNLPRDDPTPLILAPAIMLWVFAACLMYMILKIHVDFVDCRKRWLSNLRAPRAFSAVVEKLPIANAKQTMVEEYISKFFGKDSVRRVWIVVDTGPLEAYYRKWQSRQVIFDLMRRWDRLDTSHTYISICNKHDQACKAAEDEGNCQPDPDAMTHEALKLRELEFQMRTYWDRHNDWLQTPCGKTASCIVTFNSRLSAAIASSVQMSFGTYPQSDHAPGIQDVVWKNIFASRKSRAGQRWIPWVIILVFVFWLPVQLAFSQFAQPEVLDGAFPFLGGPDSKLTQLVSALLPTLLTNIVIAFLPNLLWVLSDFKVYTAHSDRFLWVSLILHLFVFICMLLPAILGNAMRKALQDLDVDSFFGFFNNPIDVIRSIATCIPGAFDTFFAQYILLTGGSWYLFFMLRLGPACLFPIGWILLQHKAYGFDLADYQAYSEGPPILFARISLEMCIVIIFAITNPICLPMWIFSASIRYVGYKNLFVTRHLPKEDTGGQYWARHTGQSLVWALFVQQLLFLFIAIDRDMYLSNVYNKWAIGLSVPLPLLTLIFYGYVFGNKLFKWKRLSLEDAIMADAGLPPRGLSVGGCLKYFTAGKQLSVSLNALVDPDQHLGELLSKVNNSIMLTESFSTMMEKIKSRSKTKLNQGSTGTSEDFEVVGGRDYLKAAQAAQAKKASIAEHAKLKHEASLAEREKMKDAKMEKGDDSEAQAPLLGATDKRVYKDSFLSEKHASFLAEKQKSRFKETSSMGVSFGNIVLEAAASRLSAWNTVSFPFGRLSTQQKVDIVETNNLEKHGTMRVGSWSRPQCVFDQAKEIEEFERDHPTAEGSLTVGDTTPDHERHLGDSAPPAVKDKLYDDKTDVKKALKLGNSDRKVRSIAPYPHMVSVDLDPEDSGQYQLHENPEGAFEYTIDVTSRLEAAPACAATILAPLDTTIPKPKNMKYILDGAAGEEVRIFIKMQFQYHQNHSICHNLIKMFLFLRQK